MYKRTLLILILILFTLAACSKEDSTVNNKLIVLGVNENSFFESIGNYFELQFNVELEFIEWDIFYRHMNEEELAEELSKHQPDVIISSSELHQKLARRSLLLELDHTLWNDDILHQPVLDLLRIHGDGQLYGWAPYFSSEMLVYNPQIYLEADVSPPFNGMTW